MLLVVIYYFMLLLQLHLLINVLQKALFHALLDIISFMMEILFILVKLWHLFIQLAMVFQKLYIVGLARLLIIAVKQNHH